MHGTLRPCVMESAGLLVSIAGVPGARHECRVGTLGATVIGSRLLLRDWGTCLAWQLQRQRRVPRVEVREWRYIATDVAWLLFLRCDQGFSKLQRWAGEPHRASSMVRATCMEGARGRGRHMHAT